MTSGPDPVVDGGASPEPDSERDSRSDYSRSDYSPSGSASGSEASELGEDAIRRWLVDYLVDIIGIDPDDVDCDAPLSDLAVGSADAVVLAGELGELLGRAVSPVEFLAVSDGQRHGPVCDRRRDRAGLRRGSSCERRRWCGHR